MYSLNLYYKKKNLHASSKWITNKHLSISCEYLNLIILEYESFLIPCGTHVNRNTMRNVRIRVKITGPTDMKATCKLLKIKIKICKIKMFIQKLLWFYGLIDRPIQGQHTVHEDINNHLSYSLLSRIHCNIQLVYGMFHWSCIVFRWGLTYIRERLREVTSRKSMSVSPHCYELAEQCVARHCPVATKYQRQPTSVAELSQKNLVDVPLRRQITGNVPKGSSLSEHNASVKPLSPV